MNQTNSNTGPIPFDLLPDSAEIGSRGELLIGGIAVDDLAAEYGTPLFITMKTIFGRVVEKP